MILSGLSVSSASNIDNLLSKSEFTKKRRSHAGEKNKKKNCQTTEPSEMKLVNDTNKIMAAMIKDSLSRLIILTPMLQFITPDHTLQELSKYEKTIR